MKKTNNYPKVAYFCMEFGLHEDFRIYSGGLGILAGDILKAAKDGGYPMVGVGILWRQGYNKQFIDNDGKVYDCFTEYRYDFLDNTGIEVKVKIRGKQVRAKVWLCNKYGNAPLYLLDTNIPGNNDRLLTGQLYGWFAEERVAQEMILSIGGLNALEALGIYPDIYHFNDSHPVLAGIELVSRKMDIDGMSFDEAWKETRKRIIYTTHTPVKAGNEEYDHELLRYIGAYRGLSYGQMLKLGGDPFSMTAAGLRLSAKTNAVSEMHCNTAKKMWQDISNASEIIPVTNGVHTGTWQDKRIAESFNDGSKLWHAHMAVKKELLHEIYVRNGVRLDENVLVAGFARRAAPYKRHDLLFKDIDAMEKLFNDRKLQVVFSGKAHPNDLDGKELVDKVYGLSRRYPENVVFLADYDMKIGKLMTRGCDIWINNPIIKMEACGTSGMKAAMNGVLNLSIADGWWPEMCVHGENGWLVESGGNDKDVDTRDFKAMYEVLTGEVIPLFYNNREKWTAMMKKSIEMSQRKFSAARMLDDYYRLMYIPAASLKQR
ncbi:MAG TPA: alpha-glucan family phosphorylase [Ruminiclostridium sp.]|jgi:starch phosphorylase|nr:alpha-glucan family phosphorylase [Clostridiaceae bacterium]HAA25821.1 alpha-glucan family phosphorylase [Ruminiclostridium sp.]